MWWSFHYLFKVSKISFLHKWSSVKFNPEKFVHQAVVQRLQQTNIFTPFKSSVTQTGSNSLFNPFFELSSECLLQPLSEDLGDKSDGNT